MADRLATQLAAFLRKERGDLTFQQFSRKTGISDSTLHRMELAEQNVTLKTLEQLCSRLKCKVSDILSPGTSKPASRGRIKTGHSEVLNSYQVS